jgi:hypothetical protein
MRQVEHRPPPPPKPAALEFAANMTLRDHFAAVALNAVLAGEWSFSDYGFKLVQGKTVTEQYAFCAYQLADAMLTARGAA